MRLFTKEELEMLDPAVEYFHQTQKQYKLPSPVELNKIVVELYEKASGEILSHDWSCPRCAFVAYEKCGQLYFKTKEANMMEDLEKMKDTPSEKPTVKRGRPKKK